MASYDGTNKSSAGCAQHLPYWEIKTEHTKNLYNEAMAMASPEAVAFCDPDNYQGPDIEVDASTLTEDQWQARRADHLGGSDISAIFGENHFKTNLDLYYAKTGKIPERDMYNTFNMGAGLVLAVAAEDVSRAVAAISAAGETAFVIGECTAGAEKGVELV